MRDLLEELYIQRDHVEDLVEWEELTYQIYQLEQCLDAATIAQEEEFA